MTNNRIHINHLNSCTKKKNASKLPRHMHSGQSQWPRVYSRYKDDHNIFTPKLREKYIDINQTFTHTCYTITSRISLNLTIVSYNWHSRIASKDCHFTSWLPKQRQRQNRSIVEGAGDPHSIAKQLTAITKRLKINSISDKDNDYRQNCLLQYIYIKLTNTM